MIEFTSDQIARAERLLGNIKGALPAVQARAINRSLGSARAEAVRAVRAEYTVSAEAVRKTIATKNATPSMPLGIIIATGTPIAMSKFDVSPTRPDPKAKRSVTVRVKKGSGRKTVKSAFLARMGSGHVGVFKRAGKKRLPIEQRFGPSVPQMLGSDNVTRQIEQKARETLDARLDHEIGRILERGTVR
ncbi:phage tail protein [Anaeroselena agilis]|uniref:Phage tail protein n=1 Tax=Anaeroselena agilis TaxID=3063788 RepID=A0ABU3NYG4_9FIRM|nr:phage tail protein [Selenomonadales bacterium 4137-cl]